MEQYQEAINYFERNDLDSAEERLNGLLAETKHDHDILNFLGIIKLNRKSYDEAILLFKQVIELFPKHPTAYYSLGFAYQCKNDPSSAFHYYQQSLLLQPEHVDTLNNLGIILLDRKEYDKAENYFNKILGIDPEYEEALINYANLKIKQDNLEEAIEILSRVSSIRGENKVFNKAAILTNLGISRMQQGKPHEALEIWEKSLKISPDNVITNYNIAHVQLLTGDYENGWKGYEWRKKRDEFKKRNFSKPELNTKKILGKTVLVYDEQGLGDSIQFARYLPILKELGCKVIFECDPRLAPIYINIDGYDKLLPRKNFEQPEVDFDFQISVLSLPRYFNTTLSSIPDNIPYISADEKLKNSLASVIRNDDFFNVGIVWAGNPNHNNDKNRSCSFEDFSPLFNIKGARFFSLQKGEAVKQLNGSTYPLVNLDKEGLDTFDHTAAVIENLDLVISVDTSVAHLAGAMGKRVWTLLPFIPDWRWMMDRNDSPWYPTMKLFRQPKQSDWENVFKEVKEELQQLINAKNNLWKNEKVIFNKTDTSPKPNNQQVLHLGLAKGENFGWGVCSKYLRKELPRFINTVDLDQSEKTSEQKIDGLLFNAITDLDFNPLYPLNEEINLGYTFFENELTEKSKENSAAFDLIYAGSSWCKNKMTEAGIFNSDLLIQGIDLGLFYPVEEKKDKNTFVIFSGGKFELRKGQDLVIKAVKILQEKYKDIVLINSWYNFWENTMLSMNNSNHIKFGLNGNSWQEKINNILNLNGVDTNRVITLPVVPHNQLRDIYAQTDIGLFPNRCEGGTNLVLMEYMACGKPVAAAFSSGHTDILNQENSILLSDLKEFRLFNQQNKLIADWEEVQIDEIVAAIEYAYLNREKIKEIGRNAGEFMKNFTWTDTAKSLVNSIQSKILEPVSYQ